jgi:ParB/RepB/Spo0J family partition protein
MPPLKKYSFAFKELPIKKVEQDPNQPRKNFGTGGDQNHLLFSIKEYGIQQPLVVSEIENGRYIILDGHRRYICAEKLKLPTVPCRVYPNLPPGQFEILRYEIQNNRRPWKPLERAEALKSIKETMRFDTNKQLAAYIHISEASISNAIQLAKERSTFLEMMASHGLHEAYQVEFIHLKPKLRRIRNLEVVAIAEVLFRKVQERVIRSCKDFVKIGKIFARATANEAELYRFLTTPEMTVEELSQRTAWNQRSLLIEQLVRELAGSLQKDIALSSREKTSAKQLMELLRKVLR